MPLGPKKRFSSGSRGAATRRGEGEEGSDTLILERCVDDLGGANAKSNEDFPAARWADSTLNDTIFADCILIKVTGVEISINSLQKLKRFIFMKQLLK
jgi:hypothetical protein